MEKLNDYMGITYPSFLYWRIWRRTVWYLWKKFLCPKNVHLFDEVLSSEHTLVCDVCGLCVHISIIETEEKSWDRAGSGLYIETSAVEKSYDNDTHCIQISQE
ncbi:hypothetical protein LCGC14_0220750 [marine sediment metagenome]|uniref:Uncharacterized protein n=1 Tax=marine sediment metagenome TaxID=412755 RepID=A0A0F9UUM4_9ZZZZ